MYPLTLVQATHAKMETNQNLLFEDLEYFQPNIFNIDQYLLCYGEDSCQFIDNNLQTQSSDVVNTSSHIKKANTELDIVSLALDLTIPKPSPICLDLSDASYKPTLALSDNTHESDLIKTLSTDNNVQSSVHDLYNNFVETEINQKFVATNGIGNNDMSVSNSHDCIETTQVDIASSIKKPKRVKKPKKTKTLKNSVKTLAINTSKKPKLS